MDTGSEASMVKEEVIQKCELQREIIRVPKLTLINAKGKKICDTNRSVAAEIKIGDGIMKTQLLVIDNLNSEIVMGTDEMHKNQVIIDYQNKKVKIGQEEVEFVNNNEGKEKYEEENLNEICEENGED